MNLTRTTAVLICLLVVLLGVSAYLWVEFGAGRPEADPRIASTLQTFTCEKCGHVFQMEISKVGAMRRAHGEIVCPKCGEPGARKKVDTRDVSSIVGKGDNSASRDTEADEELNEDGELIEESEQKTSQMGQTRVSD